MFDAVIKKWGNIDVLVNCAGITRDKLLVKETPGAWDEVLRTNLNGCFNTTKCFAGLPPAEAAPRRAREARSRHIVNVSSYSGLKGKAGQAAYSASKAALIGFTMAAAVELAGYNICVNAVLPGYMDTRMGSGAQAAMARAKEDSVLKRLSSPEEVASFIAGLIKLEGITGQIFALESRIL
jgi:NAD(P)-dependent dehydrogenase (short-subunit alcohol dehydrogenase family)